MFAEQIVKDAVYRRREENPAEELFVAREKRKCSCYRRNSHYCGVPFGYKWRLPYSKIVDKLSDKYNTWIKKYPRTRAGRSWYKWDRFMNGASPYPGAKELNQKRQKNRMRFWRGTADQKDISQIISEIKQKKKEKKGEEDE
jgi:hypothetical protein